jgi:hypothetical protein
MLEGYTLMRGGEPGTEVLWIQLSGRVVVIGSWGS